MLELFNLSEENDIISQTHWSKNAFKWETFGSPWRPSTDDIQILQTLLSPSKKGEQKALLLGVTPEVASMLWHKGFQLIALDKCPEMISQVWPTESVPGSQVICGNWLQIPLLDRSCDIVIGDGCFTQLSCLDSYQKVLQEVKRVIRPQGLFGMRFFLRPPSSETIATIYSELWEKRISNFHVFKLRLAMALHGTLDQGVRLADIWNCWHEIITDPVQLAQHLGWSMTLIATIDCYKENNSYYTFPTLKEVRVVFSEYFTEIGCYFPSYELRERCPTILFKRIS